MHFNERHLTVYEPYQSYDPTLSIEIAKVSMQIKWFWWKMTPRTVIFRIFAVSSLVRNVGDVRGPWEHPWLERSLFGVPKYLLYLLKPDAEEQ